LLTVSEYRRLGIILVLSLSAYHVVCSVLQMHYMEKCCVGNHVYVILKLSI